MRQFKTKTGEEMQKLLLVYGDNDTEFFGVSPKEDFIKEARYWIERRIEKSCKYVQEAYVVTDANAIDVKSIIADYEEAQNRYAKQLQEEEERRTLKKLKEKYEKASV